MENNIKNVKELKIELEKEKTKNWLIIKSKSEIEGELEKLKRKPFVKLKWLERKLALKSSESRQKYWSGGKKEMNAAKEKLRQMRIEIE